MKRTALALLGSLALGLLGLYLVAGPAAFRAQTYHLPTVGLPLTLLIASASAAYWIVPALRLRTLCAVQGHRLPLGTALLIHVAGLFSAAITPGGSGSAPAIAAGLRRAGVPFGRGVGVAVQVTVLDLVFFAWALPLSLAYLLAIGSTTLTPELVTLTVVSMVLAIGASTALGRYPRLVVRLFLWLARRRTLTRFRRRLAAGARGYYRSSRLFMTMRFRTWISLQALGALAWLGMFTLFWALLRVFQPVDFLTTIATLTIATLVAFIVPTPGGSGFIEVAVGYGIGVQVAHTDLATPLLLWRCGTFYLVFLLGPLASWLLIAGGFGRRSPSVAPGPQPAQPADARDDA